ncbi:MAG TPA: hypothetical protein ENK57_11500 [Polyangiaceae bacterium]|nr:hypothetical protein [Polyangiaceae bacterium]
MSLADRYRGGRAKPSGASSFTCPHYDPKPGSKRCRHYLDGGPCARPDEFMCIEWMKANGHAVPSPSEPKASDAVVPEPASSKPNGKAVSREAASPGVATDLFGNPLPEPEPVARSTRQVDAAPPAPRPASDDAAEDTPPLRGLTTEDIESFKALRVEVCLSSEAFGEVWLVPEYTGQDRKEITPEHAATICRVLEAFPGSRVIAFEKNPKPSKEADA